LTLFWLRYSPIACGTWSPCHDTEKNQGEHSSPAICDGPALALIMKVCESTADFRDASRM
jgi:hypothetical protein